MPDRNSELADEASVLSHIEQWQVEGQLPEVLARLAGEKRALQSLAAMRLLDRQLDSLLYSCRQAVENARTYPERLKKERAMPKYLATLQRSISELKEFVNAATEPPRDSLSASINIDPREQGRYLGALEGI